MEKMYKVAIVIKNDKCVSIAKVKTLGESDLDNYALQVAQYESEQERKYQELLTAIDNLDKTVQELNKEIRVLKGEDDDEEVL